MLETTYPPVHESPPQSLLLANPKRRRAQSRPYRRTRSSWSSAAGWRARRAGALSLAGWAGYRGWATGTTRCEVCTLLTVMINAIRMRTTVESDRLQIPELSELIGRRVEILVVEEDVASQNAGESTATSRRVLGSLRGKLRVPADFDEPLPDERQGTFEGEG